MSDYLALDTAGLHSLVSLGAVGGDAASAQVAYGDLGRDIDAVVHRLLAQRGRAIRTLAGVIVADGPGSFTGLRIGIAFAKGLCRAAALPLLAAPSMLGAAWHAGRGAGRVLVEYDALRGDVYRAVYGFAPGRVQVLLAPTVVPAASSPPEHDTRAGQADADPAALIALVGSEGGVAAVTDPAGWEPNYGRLAEAEARRRAQHAGG